MVQQGDWDLAQHLGCYILPFHKPCSDQTREQAWEQQKEQKKKPKLKKKTGIIHGRPRRCANRAPATGCSLLIHSPGNEAAPGR